MSRECINNDFFLCVCMSVQDDSTISGKISSFRFHSFSIFFFFFTSPYLLFVFYCLSSNNFIIKNFLSLFFTFFCQISLWSISISTIYDTSSHTAARGGIKKSSIRASSHMLATINAN